MKKAFMALGILCVMGSALASGGSPGTTQPAPVAVYHPVESIQIERSMRDAGNAVISGTVSSSQSPLNSVTINGVNVPIYENRFSGVVPAIGNSVVVRARNASGGIKEMPVNLGSAITIKVGRAVRDGGTVKVSGYIDSPSSAVSSLTVAGVATPVTAEGYFRSEVSADPTVASVQVVAQNTSGGRDQIQVDFSETAPVHGVTLKLRESGLQQVGDILEPVIDQLVPGLSGTLQTTLDNLGGSGGDAFANGTYDIHSTSIAITSNSKIALKPAEHAEKAGINTQVNLEKIALRTTVFAKGCVFWVICPSVTVPIVADLNNLGLNGNIYVGKGIAQPSPDAVFANIDAQLGLEVQNIALPEVNAVLRPFVEWVVNLVAKPILRDTVGNLLGGLVKTEVNKLMVNTVPTKIPALLVDNDNGVSETLNNIGILPLFKILVRGIGATIGVSDSFSTKQESTLAIDANFITNTVDRLVKFGYVKRDIPSSQNFLKSIQPTSNATFDAMLVIDADMLNKTTSVLNQASLMDFTIPKIDVDQLAPGAAEIIRGSDIQMRVYSRNGSPYFGVPKNDSDLLALSLTDYVLELSVDNKLLLEVNLDVEANADMKIRDNKFSIPLLGVTTRIREAKLAGRVISVTDAGLQSLIDSMGKLASSKVLQVMEILPLPVIPGNKIISIDTWRAGRSNADIALAVKLQDATTIASTSGSTAGSTTQTSTGTSTSTTSTSSNTAGVNIPTGLSSVLNSIGSIFTVVGGEPLDPLPDQVYDTVNPNTNKPHVPAINRQPIGVKDNKFTRSHMPDVRPSQDGRLGVGAFAGKLTLMKPEKLSSAFIPSSEPLMISDQSFDIGGAIRNSPFVKGTVLEKHGFSNNAICDPDVKYLPAGSKQNPYACGVNGQDDCYDIHIVSSVLTKFDKTFSKLVPALNQIQIQTEEEHLSSVPLTVRISNPKTAAAKIEEATVTAAPSISKPFSGMLFEMNSIMDGRFLLTRASGRALTWYNQPKDKYVNGNYDNVYAVFPDTAKPCDVSGFEDWKPLTHAPYDPRVKDKYKFAAYPFRDPTGKFIPDGAEIKGTYPWISRDGSVVGFSAIGISRLFPRHHIDPSDTRERYPSRCLPDEPTCSVSTRADVQFRSLDSGIAFAGLWTQGKIVLADGLINEIDFKLGTGAGDKEHSLVALYEPNTGKLGNESGEIEVGETRQTSVAGGDGTKLGNGTIFDSTTNLLNFNEYIKPATPRDVVWTFNSGRQSDEFAFDDYLNPNSFIVSHMVGALEHDNGNSIAMTYYDGWNQGALDFVNPVRVQNSATALPNVWNIPSYGEVHFGRLEPTATGGIKGKGLWLDGLKTYVSYKVEKQPQTSADKPWFISLTVDPRFSDDNIARSLIHFPDGSAITLNGSSKVEYRKAGQVLKTVQLPEAMASINWSHLAWQTLNNGKIINFYLNGYLYDSWTSETALFQVQQGQILLGGQPSSDTATVKGFRGWMDDFKMFAELTNPEVVCNHAYGTLVGLPEGYQGDLLTQADKYPSSSHSFISRIVKGYGRPSFDKYACFHNNNVDYGAHLLNVPAAVEPVRESLTFPEGPLYHALPRPDSLNNNFCLSCHHAQGKGGLGLDALTLKLGVDAKSDIRRQPMQPPARVGGNLPANWLPYSQGFSSQTGANGMAIDELLMLSGAATTPKVNGLTLVNAQTGFDVMPVENGTVIDLSQLPAKLALRFTANGVTRTISYTHNGSTGSVSSPFSIGGVNTVASGARTFKSVDLAPGAHVVTANTGTNGEPLNVSFTVTGVAPAVVEQPASTTTTPAETEESLWQTARNIFDAVVSFFSDLLSTVKNAIFGESTGSTAQAAESATRHQQIWDQSDKTVSLQSIKPAQIYFPELNKCAEVVIGYGHWDANNNHNIRLNECNGGVNQLWHSDATGRIYSMIDQHTAEAKRRCLDGTGMSAGKNVLIWDCHGNNNQKWKLNEHGKISGLVNTQVCLGANSTNDNVSLHQCDTNQNNPYQKIQWREANLSYFSMLKSKQTGKCLAVKGNIGIGAAVGQDNCNYDDPRQQWEYNALTRRFQSKVHGAYCLWHHPDNRNVGLDVCHDGLSHKWTIDAQGRLFGSVYQGLALSTGNGTDSTVMTFTTNASDTQWEVITGEDIRIRNTFNNRCLELAGAPSANVGIQSAHSCDSNKWEQRWKYDRLTGEIRNALSPFLCMTVAGAIADETRVNMQACNGLDTQRFDYFDGHIMVRSNPSFDLAIHGADAGGWLKVVPRRHRAYQSWYVEQVQQSGKAPVVPTAPAQTIRTANGKCLDMGGNVPYKNNPANVWDCVSVPWQQWHFEGGLLRSAQNPEFCLTYNQNNILGHTDPVVTFECNGHGTQLWTRDNNGLFRSQLDNRYCLDTADANPANGSKAVMKLCEDSRTSRQQWNVVGSEIKASNGRCLDFEGTSPSNSKRVITWDCAGVQWQKWTLTASGHIKSQRDANYCVDIDGSQPYEGSPLNMWQCADIQWQKWTRDASGLIRNRQDPSFCIDTTQANPQNGTQVVLSKCADIRITNQAWTVN